MHHGQADGVEAHQAEHGPVERLRLHYLADEEAQASLLLAVAGAVLTALDAGAGKAWQDGGLMSGGRETGRVSVSAPLTHGVAHVVLSLFRVQQLRLVALGFDGRPSPRA